MRNSIESNSNKIPLKILYLYAPIMYWCTSRTWLFGRYFGTKNATYIRIHTASVPSNFMANRPVPKFSWNNCAQSSKKTFMCPNFHTNRILKYTQCHISTNLLSFLKLCLPYCQTLLALAPTNCWLAEKNPPGVGTLHTAVVKRIAVINKIRKVKYVRILQGNQWSICENLMN